MTSQEVRQQLNADEKQITDEYSNLRSAAVSMGRSATQAASTHTSTSTWLPLISLASVGLFFCLASHVVIGIGFIIAGIIFASCTHESALKVQKDVENSAEILYRKIDDKSKI